MSDPGGATKAKQRVAIFTANMDGGGAERAMLKLAGGIAGHGYDVDLVLSRAEGHYLQEVPDSVRIVDLHARRLLSSIPGLVRYLRRDRPNAMLTSMNYVNIVGIWARTIARVDTRLIVNEQNALSLEAAHSPRRRHRLMPRLIRHFYPWADGVTSVARGTADDLESTAGVSPSLIEVVHNPIVTTELRELVAEPLGHPWFGRGQVPVVLGVGRLAPQKDFGTLIRAFARVIARRPCRLMILGDGPERASLEMLVAERGLTGSVDLPGWISNPYPYMAHAGVFVLSSRWEGLPSVLIEALFCGVPVVATDCLSGPREILEGGRYGALVPVGNEDALAAAIERALTGELELPPAESWEPYEQETVVRRYLEVLVGG
ncbi:MAG: glycosyltransferase [Actinobacteria bacterium]|nr:MAG: glycosyltransferase [Actinomycetota bacterium]TMM22271.1 MAG: glycosyltransferase [Actinomycetota bacterium]